MMTFLVPLDMGSKTPLYQQICEFIKKEIQRQGLRAGEKLPSARAMAQNAGVSRSTVDLAYAQLVSEGYIEARPCRGYYVCEIDGIYFSEQPEPFNSRQSQGVPPVRKSGERTGEICFSLEGIAPGGFPYSLWKKLSRRVLSEGGDDLFRPGDPCGEQGLREALAQYLYRARGVRCMPEQMIIGAGNDYLLMLLSAVLGKGRKVAMENPTYLSAYHDLKYNGYEICAVGQDLSGICVEQLKSSGADTVYVMPSHQFPMGMAMPLKRRMELLAWAHEEQGRYILEDDYDSEFRYKGKPVPALQGFDGKGCVIYLGTFSKSLAPSVRVSYMVLPKRLMEQYRKRGWLFAPTVSRADQKLLELFLKEGHYERHLNRMRTIYKNKHDLLLKGFKEMQGICTVQGEYAGVHLLVKLTNGLAEQEAVRRARREGVQVYGLSRYKIQEGQDVPEHTLVLGYACLEEEEMQEALRRLKRAWSTKNA